jgi:hypothetical protein
MVFIQEDSKGGGVKNMLFQQGNGRHSVSDNVKFAKEDIDCLSSFLGTKHYFLGHKKPTTIDAILFSFFVNSLNYNGQRDIGISEDIHSVALSGKNFIQRYHG